MHTHDDYYYYCIQTAYTPLHKRKPARLNTCAPATTRDTYNV